MAKRRRVLTKIKVGEVSLVDSPANLTPFLFWKRDESGDEPASAFEKAFKKLDLRFESDGSADGSTLTINGKTIKLLKGFTLSASPIGDEMGIYCSYVQDAKGTTSSGFKPSYTYTLTKSESGEPAQKANSSKADAADLAILAGLCDGLDPNIEADLAKALAAPVSEIAQYTDSFPASLKDAVGEIVKLATETVEATDLADNAEGTKEKPVSTENEVKPETAAAAAKPKDDVTPKDKEATPTPTPAIDVDALAAALMPKVTEGVMAALAQQEQERKDAEDPMEEVDLDELAREAEEEAATAATAAAEAETKD